MSVQRETALNGKVTNRFNRHTIPLFKCMVTKKEGAVGIMA